MSQGVRGVLLDLDGVVFEGGVLVPGAAEAMGRLEAQGLPYCFVTNTTSKGRRQIVEQLAALGIGAEADRVWCPTAAAARWLQDEGATPAALFVAEAAREDFGGLKVLSEGAETGARSVVLGDLGEAWRFANLNRAFRLLMAEESCRLVALGMTRYYRGGGGLLLDVAPFVAALECATGREAIVLGKPARAFFEAACASLGVSPGDALMVGDDIRADIEGAQRAGLSAALVRTGKFRPADLEGGVRPDLVLDSIAGLPERLQNSTRSA